MSRREVKLGSEGMSPLRPCTSFRRVTAVPESGHSFSLPRRYLSVPKTRFGRIGDVVHREQDVTLGRQGAESPERVVGTHLRDQRPQLGINLGPPSAIARPPVPVAAKPSAMPPNERLRPDDLEDPNNRWKPAIQLDEEQAVTVGQPRSAPARAP